MIYSGAKFSPCKKYRYSLHRIWDDTKPRMAFCMLNPSTADEVENDPTIARCVERAKKLGFGGIIVVNAFAYRSTDPKELYNVEDPVGPENDYFIKWTALACDVTLCGWGKHGSLNARGKQVLDLIKENDCKAVALKLNKDGSPSHPLYIGYDVKPFDIHTKEWYNIEKEE
jgi:hypothetical protein